MAISQTSGNNSAISSAGITTPSIDVAGIVSSLMTVEQQPITTLNQTINSYQAKISAIGTVQSALSSVQSAAQGLSTLTFNSFAATSSNSAVVSATASSIATPGNYSLTVSQLAQAQNLVAAGQASATTAIGSGTPTTLTFDFGTISGGTLNTSLGTYTGATFTSNGSGTKTVTIDSSNNTLSGIRNAINAANIGVTASIINDGSASPYRLVLTSNTTGVANSMKISVSGDATLSSLLSQDPAATQNLSQTAAAQNANFTVNGISVSKSSNTIGDVVHGVTLNLSGTSSTPVTVAVAPNVSAVSAAINGFVKAYNGAVQAIQNQTSYDPTTKVAGTLQGDISLSIIQSQLAAMVTTTAGSNPAGFSSLTQIGIGFQKDGTLAVDSTKLNNALSTNYQAVANLFVASGTATDNLVSYNLSSTATKAGTYGINITQPATQGTVVGSTAAGLAISSGSNDTLNLTIDGTSTSVTLPSTTYTTAAALATQLQTLINSSTPISSAGKSVTVSQNAGVFTITSSSFGSASSVTVSGDAVNNLFGTPAQTSGLDVAGTINGMAASGNGQLLTSSLGDSQGLSVMVQGSTAGSRGSITYSPGLSSVLNNQLTTMLSSSGAIASETSLFNSNISDIQKQIDTLNARIAVDQANLTAQYSQLDAMLGSMNSLSSYLTQQLARL